MKGEKTTKKTTVSSVTVLVSLLLVNLASVQAQQVLSNSDMEGCTSTGGVFGPLTDWSGVFGQGLGFAASFLTPASFSFDDDTCAAAWTVGSFPYTQTLNLALPNGASGLYDFAARFACATTSTPGTCSFSLTIGGQPITLTGTTFESVTTNTDTYETLTADNILITDPNAEVALTCAVTGTNAVGCFITQATLTLDGLVAGDPHYVGLNGQRFDIQGESGSAFNILSDFDVQVNCLLGRQQVGEHSFTSGPVMMTIAVLTPNHTILANAGGSSISDSGFVSIDGMKVGEGEKVVTEDGVSISFEKVNANSKDLGLGSDDHIAAISHVEIKGSYRFTLFFVENGRDRLLPDVWLTKFARRYLDLSVALLDDSRSPHGTLGQTHLRGEEKKRSIKDWKMEGTEDEYKLKDGVLGSDFAFNKFRV